MSKQITALLLKNKIDGIKNPNKKKEYLLNCLRNNGFIKEEEIKVVPIKVVHDTCTLCNSYNVVFSNHEKICKDCGASFSSPSINPFKTYKQDINFSGSTFIEPGNVIVKIIKDGKEVSRDLSKLNTWLSSDPEELRIKKNLDKMYSVLETFDGEYNPIIYERVKKEIIGMWYFLIKTKPDVKGKEKQALTIWCIYYPMIFNKLNINLQRLVSLFEVQIGEVYSYNFIMKDVFLNTPYERYITIQTGDSEQLNIDDEINNKIKIVKRDLKDYLNNPISKKELYGIIYFVSKINNKQYTLKSLSDKSGISSNILSAEGSKIERFYTKNLELRRRLII